MVMDWKSLLSIERLGSEDRSHQTINQGRNPYESDVDRIIFSNAFRRLSRKTQVHPMAANDHVHTRLTHSLEVARVGYSLGKNLAYEISDKLPNKISIHDLGTIVSAACMAHDIGNPPFGHGGEKAMSHWFFINGQNFYKDKPKDLQDDIINIEGNAQGFRSITQTENYLFSGGLRLTYATLGSFLKYPWNSRKQTDKFSTYITEEEILKETAEKCGLIKIDNYQWSRHPLSYLVEAADDICYGILDLEDGVELGIIDYEEVENIFLKHFDQTEQSDIRSRKGDKKWHRVNFSRIRGPIFDFIIKGAIESFIKNYEDIMSGNIEPKKDLFDLLSENDARKILITEAKNKAKTLIFSDTKKVEIELGAYATIDCLLNNFCEAAINCSKYIQNPHEESLNRKSSLVLKLLGDHSPHVF